jgi:hypothetical protein
VTVKTGDMFNGFAVTSIETDRIKLVRGGRDAHLSSDGCGKTKGRRLTGFNTGIIRGAGYI